jgi:acyl carrier protein
MIRDWDIELDSPIDSNTNLVSDLAFSSIDIIQLVVALEEHFKYPKLNFNTLLMVEGKYIDDLSVRQLVDFLAEKLI